VITQVNDSDTSNYDIEKPKLPSDEMFDPTSPNQPRMMFSPMQFEGSRAAIDAWPQRSNSSTSSSGENPSKVNSFDTPEAGVRRWSSLNSTMSGGTQAKRWVIE